MQITLMQGILLAIMTIIVGLETRLDNLVYRIGFANSIRMARQVVSHGRM